MAELVDLNEGLADAVEIGNIRDVERFIREGADINSIDPHNSTLLMLASSLGYINIVEILLENRAVIDVASNIGETALFLAAKEGHANIVEVLLAHGANINAEAPAQEQYQQPEDGPHIWYPGNFTPLAVAAELGNIDVVEKLLEAGANINGDSQNFNKPIVLAARRGHVDVVRMLIQHGAQTIRLADLDGGLDPEDYAWWRGIYPGVRRRWREASQRASTIHDMLRRTRARQIRNDFLNRTEAVPVAEMADIPDDDIQEPLTAAAVAALPTDVTGRNNTSSSSSSSSSSRSSSSSVNEGSGKIHKKKTRRKKRCPNGTRRNKKTGKCKKKKS